MKGSLGKMMEKIKTKKKKTVLAGIGLVVCCAIAGVLVAQHENPETVILKSNQAVLTVSEGTSQEVEKNLKDLSVDYSTVGKNQYVVNTKDTKKIQKSLNSIKGAEATFAEDQPFLLMGNPKDAKESKKKTDEKEIDKEETVDINDIELKEDLPEGKTWKELADERNQKLVAVIDSQVDHYAIHTENFTDMDEGVLQNHGTLVGRTIYQEAGDKAMILGLKAFAENGTGYMSDVMEAVEYARQQKVDIINLSFTTDKINEVKPLETLLQQCMDEGIQVVVAAGNFDQDIKYFSPANIDGVISVGALDEDGKRAAFSNYGDVTFYVKSPSTSQAAALVSGMLARGDDMKDVKTGDDIQVKEEENKEHLDIFENNEQGDFVTQASTQNIQLSSGGKVSWCMSGITAATITGPAWFDDGTWNLGFYAQGGYWVYAATFHDAQAKTGYAIDSFYLSGSIDYGNYPAKNGNINRGTAFVPGFTSTTVLTANTHQVAKQEHKVHYDLNGGSWNTAAISNPNGYKIIEDGNYSIQWGYNSDYYIHVKYDNAQGTGIHLYNNSTNANSIWYFERYQNTPYYFIVGDNGWDLASYGTERVDEASQVNDSSRNNHLWAIEELSNGNVALKNVGTGRYIFSHYASAGNGNSIGLWGNHDATDCQWKLVKRYTGTSAYRKKLYGNPFFVNQKAPVKPGYIFNGWASRPEWDTRAKSVSVNGRTFDRYFIQPIGDNRFEVMVHTTDSRITQVSVPIWSDANGQDDLNWPTLGRGNWTRDGQDFNWGAQITIPEEISHYSMHIYTGINGAWEEAVGSSGLDSVWMIGEQYTFDTNTDGTMYATWRKDDTQYQQTVRVRFENADGSFTSYQQAYQQTVKAGETFTWEYPENATYKPAKVSYTVTGTKSTDVTIYRKKYTATFDANGGTTASPKTLTKRAGEKLGTLPTTSRSGYTFQGWYTARTGGTKISTSTTMPTQNTTYYAQWKAANATQTIRVRYQNADGTFGSYQQAYQKDYAIGSTFTWEYAGNATYKPAKVSYTVTGAKTTDVTIYRKEYKLKVIQRLNGKNLTAPNYVGNFDFYFENKLYSDNAVAVDTTVLAGQSYEIRNIQADAGYSYKSATPGLKGTVSSDLTVYLDFETNSYTATFDANGGTTPNPKTIKKKYGEALGTLPTTSRTGYTFQGWYTAKTGGTKISTTTKMPSNNVTYYAQWKPITYKVHYNGNGSTANNPGSVAQMDDSVHTYDVKKALSKNQYEKIGWDFVGWNTKADGSGTSYKDGQEVVNLASKQDAVVQLYAQWEPSTFRVVFDPNGGETPTPFSEKEGEQNKPIGEMPTTKRKGYTFLGWFDSKNADAKKVDENTVIRNKLTTVYAHWELNSYSITYDYDGGTPVSNPTSYSVETNTFTLKNPTRTGYRFDGWTGSNGTTPQTTVTIKKGTTGDLSYTANWTPIFYTVEYNGNGATGGSTASSIHTYDKPKQLTKNGFTNSNHVFVQWNTKPDGSGVAYRDEEVVENLTTTNGATVTLYAIWEIKEVTLTFDPTGGSEVPPIIRFAGDKMGTLPETERKGYTFLGWYTERTGGTKLSSSSTVPAQNRTYYAHWETIDYSITYDLNGGKVSGNPDSYTVESNITLKNPTKTGHTFLGWTGTGLNGLTKNVTIPKGSTGDRHYTANWKAHTYTIRYNGNGSTSGSTATSTHTYGVAKNLTENGFHRTGYTFAGWNTKADGSGTSYKNAQSVKNLTSSDGAVVNLYARWYVNTYTVTFNPNMDASSNTVTIFAGTRDETLHRADGSTYTDKSGGTRTKYVLTFNKADHEKGLLSVTIKGLYGALDGTIRKVESTKTSIVDFDPSIATKVITFDPNGGTCEIESARFTVNSKLNSLPTPQREGYTFDGWFTSPDGGTRVTTSTPLGEEDRTVYAHWTAKTYTITYHGNNGSYNGKETYEDTVQWGVDYEVSTNFFTRSGWKFIGWNTKADGTGKDWTGKINQTEAWRVDSDVTLYAQWSK